MGRLTHRNLKFDHKRFSFILYIIFTGSDSYLCYSYFIDYYMHSLFYPVYIFKQ